MSVSGVKQERSYDEIMQELRQESLESLDVTREEFAEMTVPEIRRRVAEQRDDSQSLLQKLLG